MTEQLISPEALELAKQKGFDVYVCRCGGFPECICNHDNLLPTQSLVQKWLREVHGLILCVTFTNITGIKWGYNIHGKNTIYTGNSYEECLEAGLIEALGMLKSIH